MSQNQRRFFLIATGALLGAPVQAIAQQQSRIYRVGFLIARSRSSVQEAGYDVVFRKSLRDLGYIEGKNIVVEWRFAEGKYDRLPKLATELMQLKIDVIVAWAPPSVNAAKQVTSTIPIVMIGVGDPVAGGFVATLSRPGGNITGISNVSVELSVKYLELLQAMTSRLERVAVLLNPGNSSYIDVLRNIQTSAKARSVKIIAVEATTANQIEAAFGAIARERGDALIIEPDSFFVLQARQIAVLALKHRLPSIYATRDYADAGGLMSYGQDLAEHFQRVATYVDKILKGAKAGELPVEQATKLELVINRKTAKTLGLTIPQDLLMRADKVIE